MRLFLPLLVAALLMGCVTSNATAPSDWWSGQTDNPTMVMGEAKYLVMYWGQGGEIGLSRNHFDQLMALEKQVVVVGVCASACTLLLEEKYQDNLCWLDTAVFRFHGAYFPATDEEEAKEAPDANKFMSDLLPVQVSSALPPWQEWRFDVWVTLTGVQLHDLLDRGQCNLKVEMW